MCDDKAVTKVFDNHQKRFMHRRQAPIEIIETNEIDEAGDDWDKNQDQEMSESNQKSDQSLSESDASEDNDDDDKSETPDFTEVKLISKHAAFLRQSKGKHYLQYSTQN